MAEFMKISDANFFFEGNFFIFTEFVNGSYEDEQRAEGFGEVVFFEAVELAEHVRFGFIVRPLFEEGSDFFGVFTDRDGQAGDGGFDGFVRAIEEIFPGEAFWQTGIRSRGDRHAS
jgi:hypothetical protein